MFGQLFDGVAPVLQDALVPVDEADFGSARNCVHETRVIRPQERVAFVLQFLQLSRQNIVVLNRNFKCFSCTVVSHSQTFLFRVGRQLF